MKARIKETGEIVEVLDSNYQDMGGRYFDCPEKKMYIREDKLDLNVDMTPNIDIGRTAKTIEEWKEAQRRILINLDKTIEALQRNRQRISQGLCVENEHWVEAAVPFNEIMDLLGNWSNSSFTKSDMPQ